MTLARTLHWFTFGTGSRRPRCGSRPELTGRPGRGVGADCLNLFRLSGGTGFSRQLGFLGGCVLSGRIPAAGDENGSDEEKATKGTRVKLQETLLTEIDIRLAKLRSTPRTALN